MKLGKGREIGWGLLLLAGAALLIMSQVGFELTLGQFDWLEILVLLGCVWAVITGLFNLDFYRIAFGGALGYVIADGPLGWPEINGWIVFLAAFIAAMGLDKIFRRKRHKGVKVHVGSDNYVHFGKTDDAEEVEYREVVDEDHPRNDKSSRSYYGKEVVFSNKTIYTGESEHITGEYVFSGVNVYVEGHNVRSLDCDVVFSHARIYFDKASLCNDYAEINTDVVFSGLYIYVPSEWNVIDNTGRVFGHNSTHVGPYKEGAPTLCIKGDCVFGNVHIKRI